MSNKEPRDFSIRLYLLIVFGLSWPFQIVSALWGADLLSIYILNSVSMVMVAVGTFIAGKYVFRDGFANAGWRWGRPGHYLSVVGFIIILFILPTIADLTIGKINLPQNLTALQITQFFIVIPVMFIPGFGEEFGWRGYMLPRLTRQMGLRPGIMGHAVIWWAWHLPVIVLPIIRAGLKGDGSPAVIIGQAVLVILLSALPVILHAVVFAYIWTKTQSLAVSSVYHGLYIGMRDLLTRTTGLGPITAIWLNMAIVSLGIILIKKGDWQNLCPDPKENPLKKVSG